jgi:hypothetical protein
MAGDEVCRVQAATAVMGDGRNVRLAFASTDEAMLAIEGSDGEMAWLQTPSGWVNLNHVAQLFDEWYSS